MLCASAGVNLVSIYTPSCTRACPTQAGLRNYAPLELLIQMQFKVYFAEGISGSTEESLSSEAYLSNSISPKACFNYISKISLQKIVFILLALGFHVTIEIVRQRWGESRFHLYPELHSGLCASGVAIINFDPFRV
jgi:hypothetical protein